MSSVAKRILPMIGGSSDDIGHREHLAHGRHKCNLLALAGDQQASSEGLKDRIVALDQQFGRVQCLPHVGSHAPDPAPPALLAGVKVDRRHAQQRGDTLRHNVLSLDNSASSLATVAAPMPLTLDRAGANAP